MDFEIPLGEDGTVYHINGFWKCKIKKNKLIYGKRDAYIYIGNVQEKMTIEWVSFDYAHWILLINFWSAYLNIS